MQIEMPMQNKNTENDKKKACLPSDAKMMNVNKKQHKDRVRELGEIDFTHEQKLCAHACNAC